MRVAKDVTVSEVGLLASAGIILVCGSVWWLKGFAVAALVLGALLLAAAWSCIDADE
jgi:hypothetical protein